MKLEYNGGRWVATSTLKDERGYNLFCYGSGVTVDGALYQFAEQLENFIRNEQDGWTE